MPEKLTEAQARAVERPGGPILVAAAAGSGKTKVIVERLMGQILRRDQECSINDFLIITFTKKAASPSSSWPYWRKIFSFIFALAASVTVIL